MDGKIVIAGAGSIGCFVGGLLKASGRDVVLLARARITEEIGEHGLTLTSFEGWEERVPAGSLPVLTDPAAALGGAGLVIVTVKSGATVEMAALVQAHAPAEAAVLSLQNGLGNAELLREVLAGRKVLAGMVPFNVVQLGQGRFHKGTSGGILIDDDPAIVAMLDSPRLPVTGHEDMPAVLAGKLLLNLNNALNALSGLTLHEQLQQRGWRRILADCQEEALRVFRAHGIEPWSMGPVSPDKLPRLLRLPTFLFRLLTRKGIRIDRTARSSMWEDVERGRPTEIVELQGRIVELGRELGIPTPANSSILEAIRRAEQRGHGSPGLHPQDLRLPGVS